MGRFGPAVQVGSTVLYADISAPTVAARTVSRQHKRDCASPPPRKNLRFMLPQ